MPLCLDCFTLLKDRRSIRCRICNAKIAPTVFKVGQVSPRKGVKHTLEAIEKNRLAHLGKKLTINHRMNISKGIKRVVEEGRHNFYVDGKDKERHSERYAQMKTVEYRLWRDAVFQRDNYTCQMCDQYGGYLEVDHIKSWNEYPDLRLAIDNGRTLCRPCHMTTDTWGGRSRNIYRGVN